MRICSQHTVLHCPPTVHRAAAARRCVAFRRMSEHLRNAHREHSNRHTTQWRCMAVTEELEEIDPVTGQALESTTLSQAASESVKAGGFKWAYRHAAPASDAKETPVLLLHGLGSSSYSYRTLLGVLSSAGHECIAPDWIGHGGTSIPSPQDFDYSLQAYTAALAQFVDAVGIRKPFHLVVQGFVLGQYGLLYAQQHDELISKLVILNTPVDLKSALRPELAAYKNPIAFLRPKADKRFDAMTYNASGLAYAIQYRDAQAYAAPYEEPSTSAAASAAVFYTMEQLDWRALLSEVDEGFMTWKKPAALVFGGSDPFIGLKSAFNFLESKRTCMTILQLDAKLGHMPQEDYAEALQKPIVTFLDKPE